MAEGRIGYTLTQKRKLIYDYLDQDPRKRLPLPLFRKQYHIRQDFFIRAKDDWENARKQQKYANGQSVEAKQITKAITAQGMANDLVIAMGKLESETGEVIKREYDSEGYLRGLNQDVDKALFDEVIAGNVKAIELYYEITGRKVKKTESKVTVELTGDDIYRIRNKARESIPGTYREVAGDREVFDRPGVLLGEVCVGTEQDIASEGEMAELDVSN